MDAGLQPAVLAVVNVFAIAGAWVIGTIGVAGITAGVFAEALRPRPKNRLGR